MMFGVLFCIFFALFQVDCTRADQISTKIYNGVNVKTGTYRFMVSIQSNEVHICGGAIINKYYVLTAAHCFIEYVISEIKIKAGTTNLNASSYYRNVEEIIRHDNFDSEGTAEYDIALVRVETPFPLNDDSILFINLPERDDNLKVNQLVLVAGWGNTMDEEISYELKQVLLVVADHKECKKAYGNKEVYQFEITKRHFCVQSPSGIRGPCVRDSGGPVIRLQKKNKTSVPVILGIISWADTNYCGDPRYPDVLTRVSKYLGWIKRNSVY
ncbi:mite allergen Der p 3-like [Leptopilina heterotoma]|uniref:mite allergen Der p 3-like n=1 Tax=Leptopilina heterotoma TaxID=63436 RepID=UPI001CA91FB4|nr:mite allergen Der p 3-like [Leptopilina heterotoma]